jgi:hypothetical protein
MTQRLLRQDPVAASPGLALRGRVVTLRKLNVMRTQARCLKV